MTSLCMAMTSLLGSYADAQELEYKYEIGGMLGTSFYLGDTNTNSLYKNNGLAGGAMMRYNINPRMSLKFNLTANKISGGTEGASTYIPTSDGEKIDFNNVVYDLGCQYEISFWGYGMGKGYKGTRRLAPYIHLGLGFSCADNVAMNIPVGIGVKYKVAERVNIGLDWAMHFSLTDKLDGIEDPYAIKSGFLKNKDTYCATMFYVSYDICPKLRKCNNDI